MKTTSIVNGFIIAIIVFIAGISINNVFVQSQPRLSSSNATNLNKFEAGVKIDTARDSVNGSQVNTLNYGTCYIKAYATTIAASTTATVDCQATAAVSANGISALTGITVDSKVIATLATSTAGTSGLGISIIGASASTTSGSITLRISNLTGTTYTWPVTGTATGTVQYIAIK